MLAKIYKIEIYNSIKEVIVQIEIINIFMNLFF